MRVFSDFGCQSKRIALFVLWSATRVAVVVTLLFGVLPRASAQSLTTTYTSDPNLTDFTSSLGTYATFTNFTSGDVSSPFTPTSAELAAHAFRVYGGALSTGLDDTSNWIEATFSSPVSTITVFPNIDHFGSAYDGYQYKIAGSNDGKTWTLLFDATSVAGSGEPFTLGDFTGTPPTTVNNVLTPGQGPGGTVGYIAQFTFPTAYQYYAFGASTEATVARNTDQELSAVGAATFVQPISTSTPPSVTTTFSNTTGEVLSTSVVYNTSVGNIDFHGLTNPVFLTTNRTISSGANTGLASPALAAASPSDTWPQYVAGTPFATSQCTIKAADTSAPNLCSLYVRACYDQSAGPATATDANCPSIDNPQTDNDYILLTDTFDWGTGGKVPVNPGTTISLMDFTPAAGNPGEQWNASKIVPNPVCTQVAPFTPTGGTTVATQCDISDTLVDVSGDQTTTRGTKPKKGWTITVSGVPTTQTTPEAAPGTGCPLKSTKALNGPNTVWVNAACTLEFVVNPASVQGCQFGSPADPCNNYQAAPPASLVYGAGLPAVAPGPIPGAQPVLKNPNPVCTAASPCTPLPWDTGALVPLKTLFPQGDGSYPLFWLAKDAEGISEKQVVLHPAAGDPTGFQCPDPISGVPVAEPCYTTAYPSVTVNIDSTPPTVSLVFNPPGGTYSVNQPATGIFTCTDPPPNNGVPSGIATCTASVDGGAVTATSPSPVPLNTATAGAHTVTVTAVDNAGNTTTQVFHYTVLPDADVAIFEQHTSDKVKPDGTLTYLAWALDLSKTNAAEVTVTEQLQLPAAGVQLGNVKASVAIVTCTWSGCSSMPPSGGGDCMVSGTTVTCNIGTLPSIWGWKGALIKTSIPVLNTSKVGTAFKITATVNSPGDLNPRNNTTTDLLTICSPDN